MTSLGKAVGKLLRFTRARLQKVMYLDPHVAKDFYSDEEWEALKITRSENRKNAERELAHAYARQHWIPKFIKSSEELPSTPSSDQLKSSSEPSYADGDLFNKEPVVWHLLTMAVAGGCIFTAWLAMYYVEYKVKHHIERSSDKNMQENFWIRVKHMEEKLGSLSMLNQPRETSSSFSVAPSSSPLETSQMSSVGDESINKQVELLEQRIKELEKIMSIQPAPTNEVKITEKAVTESFNHSNGSSEITIDSRAPSSQLQT
jgi:hypothetical protein